jgi:hypothetical protein
MTWGSYGIRTGAATRGYGRGIRRVHRLHQIIGLIQGCGVVTDVFAYMRFIYPASSFGLEFISRLPHFLHVAKPCSNGKNANSEIPDPGQMTMLLRSLASLPTRLGGLDA